MARKLPEGMDRIFVLSGGSEPIDSCIKLARQRAVAARHPKRWKVRPVCRPITARFSRYPSLVTVHSAKLFPIMRVMPTVPAPAAWRDRDNLSIEQRWLRYAGAL